MLLLLRDIYQRLFQFYGPQGWWPAKTPFEMMAGAVLTQNTAWRNVERAIEAIGDRLSPERMLKMPEADLAALIRPCGYYNLKAARLKALCRWFEGYGFDLRRVGEQPTERLRQELLSVRGIGRETADSILLYALGRPVFVIDAYTRRIFSRLGTTLPEAYDEARLVFESALPKDAPLYNEYHALIVRHAKQMCRKEPLCSGCPLAGLCLWNQGVGAEQKKEAIQNEPRI